ncbi:MAG: transcriptional regulator BetI [Alphaproteobacteria bacterium]|nr:transcriptional regulator BetI [Alphaproteobacteria bacterium]
MPKLGMEPIRRDALVRATITEIGAKGSLDVTVGQIAARAGVSSGLAHHYFGSKTRIFMAAMRHILAEYGRSVRTALSRAETPQERLHAILATSLAPGNFSPDTVAAWLNFYVQAQTMPEAQRLLRIYHARLRSNLVHALSPLVGQKAPAQADILAALIDGIYIRSALAPHGARQTGAAGLADALLGQLGLPSVPNIAAGGMKT